MYTIRTLSLVTLAVSLSGAAVAQPADTRFDDAMARYEVGHYEAAFAMFTALADSGHCEAARIARQMAQRGKALYAREFSLDPQRAQRWSPAGSCPAALVAR